MPTSAELEAIACQVRRDILRMVHSVQSGHPGGSLGTADFMVALYFQVMKHRSDHFTMDGIGEDLFFLSNGHLSATWYSVLAHAGYFEKSELATFRRLNTRLQGHPTTAEGLPLFEGRLKSQGGRQAILIERALTDDADGGLS